MPSRPNCPTCGDEYKTGDEPASRSDPCRRCVNSDCRGRKRGSKDEGVTPDAFEVSCPVCAGAVRVKRSKLRGGAVAKCGWCKNPLPVPPAVNPVGVQLVGQSKPLPSESDWIHFGAGDIDTVLASIAAERGEPSRKGGRPEPERKGAKPGDGKRRPADEVKQPPVPSANDDDFETMAANILAGRCRNAPPPNRTPPHLRRSGGQGSTHRPPTNEPLPPDEFRQHKTFKNCSPPPLENSGKLWAKFGRNLPAVLGIVVISGGLIIIVGGIAYCIITSLQTPASSSAHTAAKSSGIPPHRWEDPVGVWVFLFFCALGFCKGLWEAWGPDAETRPWFMQILVDLYDKYR